MVSAQEFVNRALEAGYNKEEINAFLRRSSPMEGKEKQAMAILARAPDTPDPETERMLSETVGQTGGGGGGGIGSAIGSIAKTAVPVALGLAAGGPILGAAGRAIGGLAGAEAAGAGLGALGAEAAGAGAATGAGATAAAGGLGAGLGALGNVLTRPTGKEAVSLLNTYRKRGAGHALAQFGSQQAKQFAQRGAAPQEGEEAQAPSMELPQPIAQYALETFQNVGDVDATAFEVSQDLLSPGHPLNNLAKTFLHQSQGNLRETIAQFLASQAPQQQQQAPQGAQNADSGFSQVSTSDLMSLAQKLGVL